MKLILSLIFCCLYFIGLLPKQAYAVLVNISQVTSPITQDNFTVTASISGATNGTNYLRLDIYKDGTTNYFGETYNGNDWYGGSDYTSYLPISIISNKWNGQILGRIASPTSTQYDGNGVYKVRIRRYTSSGGYTASEADTSSIAIQIVIPTLTPTDTPTVIPSATPYTIPSSTKPSPTIVPSKTPTPPKSPTPTYTFATSTSSANENASDSSILGEELQPSLVADDSTRDRQPNFWAIILLVFGAILIVGCGILVYLKREFFFKNHGRSNNQESQ